MAPRLIACLLVCGVVVTAAFPQPVEPRPRASKARALKGDKALKGDGSPRNAKPPVLEEARLPPQPAPQDIPPLPERRRTTLQPPTQWPRTTVPLGPEAPPTVWPEQAIQDGLAQCRQLLSEARFAFKELSPIRKGACGMPAPIQLHYINQVPRAEMRPAATMSCPLAAAMNRWMDEVVQPRAKALLDATVIRVVNLAAYDCRPRYNNPSQRISYHAYGEAIDVAEFVTAKGEHISVLEHWKAGDERAQFLRDIHDGGCKVFGTVLGPEANEAHANHFHLDIAKRRHSAFCE